MWRKISERSAWIPSPVTADVRTDGNWEVRALDVYLVFDQHDGTLPDLLQQFAIFGGDGLRSIEHDEDEVGVGESLDGFADADTFGFVERAPDPGSVDKLHRNSSDRHRLAYQISRRAWSRCHDGALALD